MLMVDTPITGRICPSQDEDYCVQMGSDTRLQVSLKMLADVSPVTPAFSIHTPKGDVVASAQERNGRAAGVYCVEPGTYGINVRDASGARQDVRNEYELAIQTGKEPDQLEPNNTEETAVDLMPDVP